jgi:hypothetical protein
MMMLPHETAPEAGNEVYSGRERPAHECRRQRWRRLLGPGLATLLTWGCADVQTVLTQQVEAQRLAAALHLQFTQATDASNRAVMADTDEAAAVAAREAVEASGTARRNLDELQPVLESLGYPEELRHLEAFRTGLARYLALDAEILGLAVENSNLKAQRLSFGPAREAAASFRAAIEAAASAVRDRCCPDALVGRAAAGILEMQSIHARHIAEADDDAMTGMEAEMATAEAAARGALASLRSTLPSPATGHLDAAAKALDEFLRINAEIVVLSRRNSDVRSLALSLGRKRILTAECSDHLRALQEALARRGFTATR